MKKPRFYLWISVAALVAFDQLSKLFIKALVPADSPIEMIHSHSGSGWFIFHIHPCLHDRYPLYADIVLAGLMLAILACFTVYFAFERPALLRDIPDADKVKSSPRLTKAAIVFWISGSFCSCFLDAFIWGGSWDFICFEWGEVYAGPPEQYTVWHMFNLDLKDLYLFAGTALLLARFIIWQVSLYRLNKAERKLISARSFHFIRSIKELRGKNSEDIKGKNKVLDIFAFIFFAIIISFGLGYVIYILAVLVIIPVAVEISPALNAYLTEIGRQNDTDLIYAEIRSFCLLLGVLPGISVANVGLTNRERHFIHDTSGMILTFDGLKYHFDQHLFYDIISAVGFVAVCLAIRLVGWGDVSPFGFLYDRLGIPIGLALSAIITALCQTVGIIYAQSVWRAKYFYGE